MDNTALNVQLVTRHNWTETCFFYHLKSVDCGRSDLWKSFGCQWRNE